jgi:membrane protease YdiL (CAAX protease family)
MITGVPFPPLTTRVVDIQSTLYALLVVVVMPAAAVRSKAIIGGERGRRAPDRSSILTRALLVQVVLFTISYLVARAHGMALWHWTGLHLANLAIAGGALALLLAAGSLSWHFRTPDERRALWMKHLLPVSAAQWALWLLLSLAAGVAEETAYRGVLVVILSSVTASFVVAAIVSAAAFAVVHYPQGAKSMGWVFVLGLVMQAVVAATGTLYVAMGVHAVYDVTAAFRAVGWMKTEEAEGAFGVNSGSAA